MSLQLHSAAAALLFAGAGLLVGGTQADASFFDSTTDSVGTFFTTSYSDNSTGQLLTAEATWTLLGYSSGVWSIGVGLTNTTSNDVGDPVNANRITSFGFATDPTATAISLTDDDNGNWQVGFTGAPGQGGVGDFTSGVQNFDVDYCIFGGSNCQGGQGNGLYAGSTSDVELELATGSSALDFSLFAIRYQSITANTTSLSFFGDTGPKCKPNEPTCGDNQDPDPVPLPAGGLLLLTGLGAVTLVRRRKT